MPTVLHNAEQFLVSTFHFFCNPLSPRRRLTTRIWLVAIVIFTITATVFMIGCVCTDEWEITTYDYPFLNESIYNVVDWRSSNLDQCMYTITRPVGDGMVIITTAKKKWINQAIGNPYGEIENQSISLPLDQVSACQGRTEYQNVTLAFRQYGNVFRLCLDVDDDVWANVSRLCAPMDIEKCLYYSPSTVKQPFCCKKCLYTEGEVDELDENGNTTFEPIFTVIGFLIVCLILLCVCHLLAIIALWKRLVPVVMFTGILFLVSGVFMAFCLAAHQYKVSIMNTKRRILPHMTNEMALNSKTVTGWSIDAGWMGFVFCIITGILWIRFSFHLASETTYNKIRPTMSTIQNNNLQRNASVTARNGSIAQHTITAESADPHVANGYATGAGVLPKSVRWATNAANKDTIATVTPGSRPDSGNPLLRTDHQNGTVHNQSDTKTMMIEEAV